MTDILDLDFTTPPSPPPTGNAERFGGRWRLVGAGLSNVWLYGDLDLPTVSGRLLLRGPNGTGKTTALEALWPYLLDLNAAKLAAGKARPTTLKLLMSEGAPAKGRRYGYLWLSFAEPADTPSGTDQHTAPPIPPAELMERVVSFGVRLQYSPSASPAVTVVPFTVPGRPLKDLQLRTTDGAALEHEEFCTCVEAAGGRVFRELEEYVEDLAARIWSTTAGELRELASRLREVRNPTLLGEVSPAAAADALRQSLPGVAGDVLSATAEALAESDSTREAFEQDEHAATVLAEFARVWTGHAVDVTKAAYTAAREADDEVGKRDREARRRSTALKEAHDDAEQARTEVRRLDTEQRTAAATARAIETSDAYKAHGRINDLHKRLTAEQRAAASNLAVLVSAADQARAQTTAGRQALDDALTDLADLAADAAATGMPPPALDALLAHHARARITRPVGDRDIDPGPGLTLIHDRPNLEHLATTWRDAAQTHRTAADKAALVLRDHGPVAEAAEAAEAAHGKAARAETTHDEARQAADRATEDAHTAARQMLASVTQWSGQHPQLCTMTDDAPDVAGECQAGWEADDVAALADAEPATVRDQLNAWAEHALRTGEAHAADHEAAAKDHLATATDLTATAEQHRAEARRLRAGQLLPLPRPDWAGPGDDDSALGTVLEWRDEQAPSDQQKAQLELALASAGILGAHLHPGGATTHAWHISPTGAPPQQQNLTAVLDVAAAHPHADLARAVLTRVALVDSAIDTDPASVPAAAVVIGRDGTFAVGPLGADPATALDGEIPAASHIGARTRLARARARADELDASAHDLEATAEQERQAAAGLRARRDTVRAQARSFPERGALTGAEAERARTAKEAHRLATAARELRRRAEQATAEHTDLRTAWQARARSLGMPTDHDELTQLIDTGRAHAEKLHTCARQLTDRFLPKLDRILHTLPDEADLNARLATLQHEAQSAHSTAAETQAELHEAQSHGDAADAARRFQTATARAGTLAGQLEDAREAATVAEKRLSTCESELTAARRQLTDARPRQSDTHAHLATLLAWPPLVHALGADAQATTPGTTPSADAAQTGPTLLDSAERLLAGRPTASRKILGERYDEVRAELAQTWTIARDDPPAGLDELHPFVLTHAETHYDPLTAATRAQTLAARAKKALDAAEEAALRDFVIGRLPAAIGTAWTALQDWKKSVNTKMRTAQASSGVGVQVHIELRDDLDPSTRTVYELCCEVSDAVRTEAQKQQVGQALQALLAASDGITMTERLAAAVDIRDWVDVHYLVERPSPDGQPATRRRWGPRTGLSGGERRLVVLAPMLAAIAANYERFPDTGLRLVPLDEVPAEVDERGREGLARYLAALDLDILCTSYLWDGAPGAWDGVDAYDLEKVGTDPTVVAFPMHIRGPHPLPGDTDTQPAPEKPE